MAKDDTINELTGILATALDGRPELMARVSSLLGSRQQPGPGERESKLTFKQRKEKARVMFSKLAFREELKNKLNEKRIQNTGYIPA